MLFQLMQPKLRWHLCFVAPVLALLLSCKGDNPTAPTGQIGLRIEAGSLITYSGGSIQFRAFFKDEAGTESDVTQQSIWRISPASVGTIDANGLFNSVNNVSGAENVTAEFRSVTASAEIMVEPRAVVLGVSPVLTNVAGGESVQFKAAVVFVDGSEEWVSDRVEWSVEPAALGSMNGSRLFQTAPGASGPAKIIARYHGRTHESEVEIQSVYQSRFPMVEVPSGEFTMGSKDGKEDERPAHRVTLDAFEIGKFEVTNAEYSRYLNDAFQRGEVRHENGIIMKNKPPFYLIGMTKIFAPEFAMHFINFVPGDTEADGTFEVTGGFEDYPVGRLTWYGAATFCDFYGLRLPSEAEWERAARAGQQLPYATADGSISHDLANISGTGGQDTFENGSPVGSFPPNPFGIHDMCGNVFEFVCDFYAGDYYQNSPVGNPTGPVSKDSIPDRRALLTWLYRGGSWVSEAANVRAARRGLLVEPHDNVVILEWAGFRVAR